MWRTSSTSWHEVMDSNPMEEFTPLRIKVGMGSGRLSSYHCLEILRNKNKQQTSEGKVPSVFFILLFFIINK